MIDNSDKVGTYRVVIIANKNQVNAFQCPTKTDAIIEAGNIVRARRLQGLETHKAYMQLIYDKSSKGLHLGPQIKIPIFNNK